MGREGKKINKITEIDGLKFGDISGNKVRL
jgi:hypothetical protein